MNKLLNKRFLIAAEKWMVRSTGVGGFISLQNGNLRRQKLLRVFRRFLFFALLRFVSMREGQIQNKLY